MLTADRFVRSGKVRDLYELSKGRLLLVASDRISAFDVILPTEIPDKGRVLTGLSRFWFAQTAGIVENHLLDTDVTAIGNDDRGNGEGYDDRGNDDRLAGRPPGFASAEGWRGRVMICQVARVVPIEAVVRGYLAGSGWQEYHTIGSVGGVRLRPGMGESDALPEPIFSPATKASPGEHDLNIDFDAMVVHIGRSGIVPAGSAGAVAEAIRAHAIALYRHASRVARQAGILLADTKFEFGIGGQAADGRGDAVEARLILIDEALTPDSSRFWDAASYQPGRPQVSFDKQFVRDWLDGQGWDRTAPGPALPAAVVAGTRDRYVEAFERITGASFERYLREDVLAS